MSSSESDSDDYVSSTHYPITKKKKYQAWYEKTMARAREKGFDAYFTTDRNYHTKADLITATAAMDAEANPVEKKKKEREMKEMKESNKLRASAAGMLT